MTDTEAELAILSHMTPGTKKFAVAVGFVFDERHQHAFERLMLRDWIRLIDVAVTLESRGQPMRIFRVMPEAVAWYKQESGA